VTSWVLVMYIQFDPVSVWCYLVEQHIYFLGWVMVIVFIVSFINYMHLLINYMHGMTTRLKGNIHIYQLYAWYDHQTERKYTYLSTICMVWPPDWKEKYIIQSLMYFEYMKLTIRLLLSGLSIGFNDSVTYYHNFLKINLIILINCKKKPFKNTQLRYVSRKGFLVVNNSSKHWRTFCFNFAILLTTSYQKQKLH
jgi:hypothetical protein